MYLLMNSRVWKRLRVQERQLIALLKAITFIHFLGRLLAAMYSMF